MSESLHHTKSSCKTEVESTYQYRERLAGIADHIINACQSDACSTHVDFEPIPSKVKIIEIINNLREIIFPGYFCKEKLDPMNLKYAVGQTVSRVFDLLSEQICHSIQHDCFRYDLSCQECSRKGNEDTLLFLESIPKLQELLDLDVKAAFEGDPAAKSLDEIIFSYPGMLAITVYRIAHILYELNIPLIPRIMTEYAHGETGIDIHPGAEIGKHFVIDHGTGVVIGETTTIGNNVRIYQGVTLGALSLPKGEADKMRNQKRHPTIEDDCIIYSGATVLGGDTIIGKGSVIGGNVWLTESIPPGTKVMLAKPQLVYH